MGDNLESVPSVFAPVSKSEFHRALIMAALTQSACKIFGYSNCADVKETIGALTALGVKISKIDGGLAVDGSEIKKNQTVKLNISESASTLRFLLPVLGALGISGKIFVGERLYVRFNDDDVKFYDDIGINVKKEDGYIAFCGKLFGGCYAVSAAATSQNLSGLIMALPTISENSTVFVNGAVSRGYALMTLEMLEKFDVKHTADNLHIELVGKYKETTVSVSGDYSAAANFALFGTLKNSLNILGLAEDSAQPDKAFLKILNNSGGKAYFDGGTLCVRKAETLHGFCADLTDTPDVFPVCAVLAAFSTGESVLIGTNRLKNKESDRLAAIERNLSLMGIKFVSGANRLQIFGGNPKPFVPDSFSDHRIAMAFSVAALALAEKPTYDACVTKSYPNFFEELERICQN